MAKYIIFIATFFLLSCKATTTCYIVRHAEKETATTMTTDVSLSVAGKQRAEALKELLKNEKIKNIYSTNYVRTKSTAQPLSDAIDVPVKIYDPGDETFVSQLKSLNGNVLIVGHSNTVNKIVNKLTGETKIANDLPDSQYGDLFVIKKKGNKYRFKKRHFGL